MGFNKGVQKQPKMNSEFKFTRYLYEVEEVIINLNIEILKKNSEKALWWAFELFYSGYKIQLTYELWYIYYNYFATSNPKFETYLLTKINTEINDPTVLASIINNFTIRPFNVDIFMLKNISTRENVTPCGEKCMNLLKKPTIKWELISSSIKNWSDEMNIELVLTEIIEYINSIKKEATLNVATEIRKYKKTMKIPFNKNNKSVLLSRIIYYFHLDNTKQIGKNLFAEMDDDLNMYKTQLVDLTPQGIKSEYSRCPILPARKILQVSRKGSIDEEGYLSLFDLKRDHSDIKKAFHFHWEYYASFSPIWAKRIESHNGVINHTNKTVTFDEEGEDHDSFYDHFGYEPDEQLVTVQNMSIGRSEQTKSWVDFHKQFNKNGIIKANKYIKQLVKVNRM
uniref:Uncharacterized protein n=1 Tax=viral metagenome TaxID=1070528 RepID=A0A6C0LKQ3_9ZZZZ